MAGSRIPELDDELRRRLGRRFGTSVEAWLDELPPTLSDLAERWQLEFESLIQRGSISVVLRCRTVQGRPAVLKVSPARVSSTKRPRLPGGRRFMFPPCSPSTRASVHS